MGTYTSPFKKLFPLHENRPLSKVQIQFLTFCINVLLLDTAVRKCFSKQVFLKNIHRKTPVLEPLFNKVVAQFLRAFFFLNLSDGCFWPLFNFYLVICSSSHSLMPVSTKRSYMLNHTCSGDTTLSDKTMSDKNDEIFRW